MIARIEALNYRCLRYVAQELEAFNVLVGPNGAGKSTFLDVVGLLRDFLNDGLDAAILMRSDPTRPGGRARRVEELFFQGQGDSFGVAIELRIPERLLREDRNALYSRARYEVEFGRNSEAGELAILGETFWLTSSRNRSRAEEQGALFPEEPPAPQTLLSAPGKKHGPTGWRTVVNKVSEAGNDYFKAESGRWNNLFKIGPRRAALANLPEDPDKFPVAMWARDYVRNGVQRIALNVHEMRRPCSPSLLTTFAPDGSNLPRVVWELERENPGRFTDWLQHVRTILPEVSRIDTVETPEDKRLYLRIHHTGGEPVPSWLLSDGTLRMLVLTLLPYLCLKENVYLIEEPENGVHPQAIEAVYDALSSVYDNQVLLATHSPLILGRAEPRDLLCFARTDVGSAVMVRGDRHPRLLDWRGEVSLATLYASGVLS
jgi:predicted ATPase